MKVENKKWIDSLKLLGIISASVVIFKPLSLQAGKLSQPTSLRTELIT